MDTKLATSNYRIRQWTEIFHDQKQSGLKVEDYCESHGITHHQYYYWLKKVRQAALESCEDSQETGFIDVSAVSCGVADSRISDTESGISAFITINGCKICISDNASSDFIGCLIGALKHA